MGSRAFRAWCPNEGGITAATSSAPTSETRTAFHHFAARREEQIALQPRRSRRWAITELGGGADIHSRARDGDPAFKFSRRTMHEASSTHMTKSGSQT